MSYDWLRSIALADLPQHRGQVRPEFWRDVEEAEDEMQPTQRRVYDLYRCGMTTEAIAIAMGWKRSSVRARLAEVADLVRAHLDSKPERPKIA